jgi:hypothetical protein
MGKKKKNVVISSWRGIITIRSKPVKVKQTHPTIRVGRYFGMAANRAGIIRKLLNPVIPDPASRDLIYRLQDAFYQWLRAGALNNDQPINNIPFFNGLSLNEKNELKQFLRFPVSVNRTGDGQLLLHLPAFDPVDQIKAPADTRLLYLKIAVVGVGMGNPDQQETFQTELAVPYIAWIFPAQDIRLQLATMPGRLVIVTIALQYFTGNTVEQIASQLPWKPTGIVGSFFN